MFFLNLMINIERQPRATESNDQIIKAQNIATEAKNKFSDNFVKMQNYCILYGR